MLSNPPTGGNQFASMKISWFIFLGFLLILLLFSITTYINFRQAEDVNENSAFFARSSDMVRNTNRFQRNILNMISGLRGFLLTGENHFIQAYDSSVVENQQILEDISSIIPDDSDQKAALLEIAALNRRWVEEFAAPLILAKRVANESDSAQRAFNTLYREKMVLGDERNLHRSLQVKFKVFSNFEYNLREQNRLALTESIRKTRTVSFLLTSFSIAVGLGIALFLAYRVSSNVVSMVRMSDAIAAGNYSVSTRETGMDEFSQLAHSLNHMARVLSENIELLKRKNEELDQFAHIVSHDLKAPLRGIDNVITWIEEDHSRELSPKVNEYIELIKTRLQRAENLIKGILIYSRVGRDRNPKERVDLNALFEEIHESLEIPDHLKLEIPPGLPNIVSEKIPLQQTLLNLIGNAVKYHDKPSGRIWVEFFDRDDHYEFRIADDGPGIGKNYHEKIFMIFQTLQERDSFESTGVGLAIVKKILDDRQQTIQVSSEAGKGSVFVFTWPKHTGAWKR